MDIQDLKTPPKTNGWNPPKLVVWVDVYPFPRAYFSGSSLLFSGGVNMNIYIYRLDIPRWINITG